MLPDPPFLLTAFPGLAAAPPEPEPPSPAVPGSAGLLSSLPPPPPVDVIVLKIELLPGFPKLLDG